MPRRRAAAPGGFLVWVAWSCVPRVSLVFGAKGEPWVCAGEWDCARLPDADCPGGVCRCAWIEPALARFEDPLVLAPSAREASRRGHHPRAVVRPGAHLRSGWRSNSACGAALNLRPIRCTNSSALHHRHFSANPCSHVTFLLSTATESVVPLCRFAAPSPVRAS